VSSILTSPAKNLTFKINKQMAAQLTVGLVHVITKRDPIMEDGIHQTWESPNGTFYKWFVEIDGKKGTALSKDTDPWWKAGVSVEYTLETKEGGKYGFKGFKKPQTEEAKGAHIKEAYKDKPSAYNDPTVVHQFAMSQAIEQTIRLFQEIGYAPASVEQLSQNFKFLYSWLMADKAATRDIVWTRVSCLKAAITCINAGKTWDDIGMVVAPGWLYTFLPDTDGVAPEKLTSKLIRLADEFYKSPSSLTKETI